MPSPRVTVIRGGVSAGGTVPFAEAARAATGRGASYKRCTGGETSAPKRGSRLLAGQHREMGGGGGTIRAALAAFDAVGGLERWIAERLWQAAPGGWAVLEPPAIIRAMPKPGGA